MNNGPDIQIQVKVDYVEHQSRPEEERYVFAYTITVSNQGIQAAKLLTRHWVITDANGKVQEVRGQGVVGEQPYLRPGEAFQYTSATMIETPVGSMQGSYGMLDDGGKEFDATIPPFSLARPNSLH